MINSFSFKQLFNSWSRCEQRSNENRFSFTNTKRYESFDQWRRVRRTSIERCQLSFLLDRMSHPPNGLLAHRIKSNQVNDSNNPSRANRKTSPADTQSINLKRQQSVEYDRRRQSSQSNRRSVRINIIPNTSQRSSQENPSRGIKIDPSNKRS